MTQRTGSRGLRQAILAASVAIAIGQIALAADEPKPTTDRPVVRAAPELAVGGVTREERVAQMLERNAALSARLPAGVQDKGVRVGLTDDDIALIEEDTSANGPAPLRIGLVKAIASPVRVAAGVGLDRGVSESTGDGEVVWAMSVSSPGAQAIRVHITEFSLPDGAEMYFYDSTGLVDGPYTGAGRNNDGDFWTRSIGSDSGIIQLHFNEADRGRISFVISEVAHIRGRPPRPDFQNHDNWPCADNAPCVVDASCGGTNAAVNTAKAAIAKLEWLQGPFVNTCTGGLIADTDGSTQIPYLLTANHCFSNDKSNLETWFDYTTSSCNGTCPHNILTGGAPPSDTVGIDVVASSSSSDYTLGILGGPAPAGAAFLGWSTNPVATANGTHLYRISNPNFGPQAYSEHDVDTSSPTCTGIPRGAWIYSKDIVGATMGGSSGSPVVNAAGEIVGQLTGCCGFNCGNECDSQNNWTIDGAFAAYFANVAQFLDPQGGGGCSSNAECDDGLFCTGTETCVSGSCQSSGNPCPGGTTCNESTNTCDSGTCGGNKAPCSSNADCCSGNCRNGSCKGN